MRNAKTTGPVEFTMSEETAMKIGMLVERPDQRKKPLVAAIQLALLRDIVAAQPQPKDP